MKRLALQTAAFLRRDLLVEASYKANVLLGLVSGFALLMTFYFVGSTVGAGSPHLGRWGGDYFAFSLVGLAASGPLHAALLQLSRRVRETQVSGTLEAILATPLGPARAVLLSALWPVLSSVVRMAALLAGAALVFGLPLDQANFAGAALVLLLSLAAYAPLGLLSAAFTIRFQRGDPVAVFLNLVSVLLGGVFYPVTVLPAPLRAASQVLPLTHALEALRLTLLRGASVAEIAPQLRVLLACTAVLGPLALYAFRRAVRRAKELGSLTHF